MRVSDLDGAATQGVWGYDFEESRRLRKASQEQVTEAIQKVEEAQQANTTTTLDMMDSHNEMVKKSQEAAKEKDKKRAIERQNQKRREEHSELLAEMAIRNAERRDLLEALRLKG
jgi:methylthioribose-1-phosphate isomerase